LDDCVCDAAVRVVTHGANHSWGKSLKGKSLKGKSLKGKSMRSMNKVIVLSGLAAFAIAMLGVTIWISEPAKSKEDKGDNGQTITRLGF
jgi:hypothetical protein